MNPFLRVLHLLHPPNYFVHVGKCGGSSVKSALKSHGIPFEEVHIKPVVWTPRASYCILLRDPIDRALSAFNWRYRLVVTEGTQQHRFPGERAILERWGTLNALAEALYDEGGVANEEAIQEFRTIHHLKESIGFYFQRFNIAKHAGQIQSVMFQESLDADFKRTFQADLPSKRLKHNPISSALSARAESNLRRVLASDYAVIEALHAAGHISQDRYESIMRHGKG